jgi:hypothetical protein
VGVSAALVLAACGGGGGAGNNEQPGTQTSASGFNAASTSVVNPSDKKGGTLKFATKVTGTPLTLARPITPTRGISRGCTAAR